MKVALLQLNPTVGAVRANSERLVELANRAAGHGARLAVAPELSVVGYPPKDLLDRPTFVRDAERATEAVVAKTPAGLTLLFGTIGAGQHETTRLTNDAVAAENGRLIARATKQLLPSYDVFDEDRYFEAGSESTTIEVDGSRVLVTICEDAWAESENFATRYRRNPLAGVGPATVDLIVNLSASPFTLKKLADRPALFRGIAVRHRVPVVLVNQVGGNDELIFDGRSAVWDREGRLLSRAEMFSEDLVMTDLGEPGALAHEATGHAEAAYGALVLGVGDYTRKCGFRRVVIGLSGGVDSALTAVIARDALGPQNVLGIAMPSRYSSPGSLEDARALAKNLGIPFRLIDIDPIFSAYIDGLGPVLDDLCPEYEGDTTFENIQARIRGAILMAVSNRSGALVLTTGNKSEVAVGYCTLYGDMVGGLAVISDVPKTTVYDVARWINRDGERIPERTIRKEPSAELRPGQKDADSLPPYDVLDPILELFVEEGLSQNAIVERGFDPEVVARVVKMVRGSEYKRRQMAPGLIITSKAFGPGRRMPVAQGYFDT